ncbi:hypothetical protein TNCV_4788471 [Trichonephila clavipes]|nr:hypothetical protein TNCV_4788471 [Trichonephila clavipes]
MRVSINIYENKERLLTPWRGGYAEKWLFLDHPKYVKYDLNTEISRDNPYGEYPLPNEIHKHSLDTAEARLLDMEWAVSSKGTDYCVSEDSASNFSNVVRNKRTSVVKICRLLPVEVTEVERGIDG